MWGFLEDMFPSFIWGQVFRIEPSPRYFSSWLKKKGTYLSQTVIFHGKKQRMPTTNAKERWIVEHQCEWQTFSGRMGNFPTMEKLQVRFTGWNFPSHIMDHRKFCGCLRSEWSFQDGTWPGPIYQGGLSNKHGSFLKCIYALYSFQIVNAGFGN